jgi:hypothetical protein
MQLEWTAEEILAMARVPKQQNHHLREERTSSEYRPLRSQRMLGTTGYRKLLHLAQVQPHHSKVGPYLHQFQSRSKTDQARQWMAVKKMAPVLWLMVWLKTMACWKTMSELHLQQHLSSQRHREHPTSLVSPKHQTLAVLQRARAHFSLQACAREARHPKNCRLLSRPAQTEKILPRCG